MKIGILTYHCAHNYGAILQCYALQETLKGMGYDATVINYRPSFLIKPYNVFQRYRFSFRKPYRLPFELWRELRYAIPRWVKFERSIGRLLDMSEASDRVSDAYDVYIIGSDQIWNTRISGGDRAYFASFEFPKGDRKYVAYAASMEAGALSGGDEEICRQCLPLFDCIGVRESNLIPMLQPFTDTEIQKVADPVFLLNRSKWLSLTSAVPPRKNYLLLYQVRENETLRSYAKTIAEQKGLRFVEVTSWVKRTPYGKDDFQTSSLEEFLTLFRYADYVVTTSFHGTAFSLIFERQFTSVELGDGADSRVRHLLDMFGLGSRISPLMGDYDQSTIEYGGIESTIEQEREKSISFLEESIHSK